MLDFTTEGEPMRPELKAYFDDDESHEPRPARHSITTRKALAAVVEPYFAVYVKSLRKDCTEGEYEYWDGECLEYVTAFGRVTRAKFVRREDALDFARQAYADRERLATMHDVKDAAMLCLVDHNGRELERWPLLKVVPAATGWGRWLGWWRRMMGW